MKYVGEIDGFYRLEFDHRICDFGYYPDTGDEFIYLTVTHMREWQEENRAHMELGYGEAQDDQGHQLFAFYANFRELKYLLLFKATCQ